MSGKEILETYDKIQLKRRENTRVSFNSRITDFIKYKDIASLPASLFSTPVKLSDFPHWISFHHFIFCKHLNAEMREINKHEFPLFISLNQMGAINIEFPFTICQFNFIFFLDLKWGKSMSMQYIQEDICLKKNQSL